MRISKLKDYEIIDTSNGEKLERWKDVILIRPDPQIIWNTKKKSDLWDKANARYVRSDKGGGKWDIFKHTPEVFEINHNDIIFRLKLMGFKHTGLFPEQAANWNFVTKTIKDSKKKLKVLNMFAYTGGATLACAKAGAEVCHVDASRGMVNWAKENAKVSNMTEYPIRWIVDDCIKFAKREQRRGNKYDIIIMDPPSYGRGSGGELWKLEEQIYPFIELCETLLTKDAKLIMLNSYTTGLSPAVMEYMLGEAVQSKRGGTLSCDEIGTEVKSTGLVLPCGNTAMWLSD